LPPGVAWSLGGDTRLALLYGHRISYDLDIFVADAQAIGWLTPRLNDKAAALFGDAYEEDSSFIKFAASEGDIDIIVARLLTEPGAEPTDILGRIIPAETAEEILAKKIQFRAHAFRHRDAFDLAMLLARDPDRVAAAMAACTEVSRARLRQRLDLLLPVLAAELPEYVNPTESGRPLLAEAAPRIRAWLDA
jgi:hypothetical protein